MASPSFYYFTLVPISHHSTMNRAKRLISFFFVVISLLSFVPYFSFLPFFSIWSWQQQQKDKSLSETEASIPLDWYPCTTNQPTRDRRQQERKHNKSIKCRRDSFSSDGCFSSIDLRHPLMLQVRPAIRKDGLDVPFPSLFFRSSTLLCPKYTHQATAAMRVSR